MRPLRSFLDMLIRYLFGASNAIALQTPWANAFAAAQSSPSALSGGDDVQALAARCFAEAHEPEALQPVPYLPGGCDHLVKPNVRRWIKVENEPTGLLGLEGLAVPRVQLQGSHLSRSDQRFDAIKLEVGLSVTPDRHLIDEAGLPLGGVSLEELLLAGYAIGEADHRARPAVDVSEQPVTD